MAPVHRTQIATLGLLGAALVLSGCGLAADVTPPPGFQPVPPAATAAVAQLELPSRAPSVANGARIYTENCAACHGPEGLGDGEVAAEIEGGVPNLTVANIADTRTLGDHYLVITNGRLEALMPPWRDELNLQERWDVAAYVYGLSLNAETIATGEDVYAAQCASCHGDLGRGDGPDAEAALADLTELAYAATQTRADVITAITQAHEAALLDQMTGREQQAVVAFTQAIAWRDRDVSAVALFDPETFGEDASADEGLVGDDGQAVVAPDEIALGTVSGVLVNGTSPDEIPAGTEVTLRVFDNMLESEVLTATTDADGAFSFDGIELPVGRAFIVTTEYAGVTYNSLPAAADPERTSYDLSIDVFETSDDRSGLAIGQMAMFVEPVDGNTYRVVTLLVMDNTGNTTVVGSDDAPPFVIPLPEGAQDLQFDTQLGASFVQIEGAVGIAGEVRPGLSVKQALYSYVVPEAETLALDLTLDYPIGQVQVFIPEGQARLDGDGLLPTGVQAIQGQAYETWSRDAISAGDTLAMRVRPPATGLLGGGFPLRELLLGSGMLLIALAAVLFIIGRRGEAAAEAMAAADPRGYRDQLLDELAALDAAKAAGEIDLAEFTDDRDAIKQELIEHLQRYGLPLRD